MNKPKQTYSRGQLAKLTSVNAETIRYYEKSSLLDEPARSIKGYRIYSETDVSRLTFIRRSRELGFSINEIKALLNLQNTGEESCGYVQQASQSHLTDIQNKITDLKKMEKTLISLIKQCKSNTTQTCPMIDTLFS